MNDNEVYELREARAEISRHHALIVELRDALLDALNWTHPAGLPEGEFEKYRKYRRLINRQVS